MAKSVILQTFRLGLRFDGPCGCNASGLGSRAAPIGSETREGGRGVRISTWDQEPLGEGLATR